MAAEEVGLLLRRLLLGTYTASPVVAAAAAAAAATAATALMGGGSPKNAEFGRVFFQVGFGRDGLAGASSEGLLGLPREAAQLVALRFGEVRLGEVNGSGVSHGQLFECLGQRTW